MDLQGVSAKVEAGGPDFYLQELMCRDSSASKTECMAEANGNGFRRGAVRPWHLLWPSWRLVFGINVQAAVI